MYLYYCHSILLIFLNRSINNIILFPFKIEKKKKRKERIEKEWGKVCKYLLPGPWPPPSIRPEQVDKGGAYESNYSRWLYGKSTCRSSLDWCWYEQRSQVNGVLQVLNFLIFPGYLKTGKMKIFHSVVLSAWAVIQTPITSQYAVELLFCSVLKS